MNVLEKILEEIKEATFQEDTPIYMGDMEVDGYVRASRIEEIIRSHMEEGKDINVPSTDDWIPVKERLPKDDRYILLSFENFSLPLVGRYEESEKGGAFYIGGCDEADTCVSNDLFVNAWQPLPEPYKGEEASENE